ncbi:unnamed protein product [Microthlaspi erraticum]|uniref:F-box domain-containing protein n=1 Tax=Microthlaspi erraticum TaxID=1685480 RepID=A0A6D2K507_9BRAS|nr:unnamed protein product [Microthlaspi erraticum]
METRRRQNVSEEEDLQTVSLDNTRSSTLANKGEHSAERIPTDLIIEILLKLPVTSIARCRCVSKLWDSIIRRPYFPELILTRSMARPQLLFACKKDGNVFFFSSSQPQDPDEKSSPVAANYHMKFQFDGYSSQFSYSVHRLIFIKFMMVICNPSTGQSLTLPNEKTIRIHVINFFGYNPVDKQLKVLSMTRARSGRNRPTEEHQVLTLGGTEKLSWRMIECSLPHYPQSDGICINGVLYYKAVVYGFERRYGIVCFDTWSEKFEFLGKQVLSSKLVNYLGKLGILHLNVNDHMVELCVLEDAKKHEWSKRIFGPPALQNDIAANVTLDVVGVTRRGEIVLSECYYSEFVSLIYYNLERNILTKVEVQGLRTFRHWEVHTFLDHVEDVKLGGVFRTT